MIGCIGLAKIAGRIVLGHFDRLIGSNLLEPLGGGIVTFVRFAPERKPQGFRIVLIGNALRAALGKHIVRAAKLVRIIELIIANSDIDQEHSPARGIRFHERAITRRHAHILFVTNIVAHIIGRDRLQRECIVFAGKLRMHGLQDDVFRGRFLRQQNAGNGDENAQKPRHGEFTKWNGHGHDSIIRQLEQ